MQQRLVTRSLVGIGTPRSLQGRLAAGVIVLWTRVQGRWRDHGRHPPITLPCSRHIMVSSCCPLAHQKATFGHGPLVPWM